MRRRSGTGRCSSTSSMRDEELMWTDDHEPPTPTSAWKPGQTVEYTPHDVRADVPLRGPRQSHRGALRRVDERAAQAEPDRSGGSLVSGGRVRAAAADRKRLPDLQGRMAPGGSGAGQSVGRVAVDEEGSDAELPQSETRCRRCFCSSTIPVSAPGAATQVEVRIGDQVDRHRAGRRQTTRRSESSRSPPPSLDRAIWWRSGSSRIGRLCPRSSPVQRATIRGSSVCECFTRSCSRKLRLNRRVGERRSG